MGFMENFQSAKETFRLEQEGLQELIATLKHLITQGYNLQSPSQQGNGECGSMSRQEFLHLMKWASLSLALTSLFTLPACSSTENVLPTSTPTPTSTGNNENLPSANIAEVRRQIHELLESFSTKEELLDNVNINILLAQAAILYHDTFPESRLENLEVLVKTKDEIINSLLNGSTDENLRSQYERLVDQTLMVLSGDDRTIILNRDHYRISSTPNNQTDVTALAKELFGRLMFNLSMTDNGDAQSDPWGFQYSGQNWIFYEIDGFKMRNSEAGNEFVLLEMVAAHMLANEALTEQGFDRLDDKGYSLVLTEFQTQMDAQNVTIAEIEEFHRASDVDGLLARLYPTIDIEDFEDKVGQGFNTESLKSDHGYTDEQVMTFVRRLYVVLTYTLMMNPNMGPAAALPHNMLSFIALPHDEKRVADAMRKRAIILRSPSVV